MNEVCRVAVRWASDVCLLGELEAGDEGGEREADEGEEGHADGRRRRVGEHVVRALTHAVGDWDRGWQRRHHQVGGNLEKRRELCSVFQNISECFLQKNISEYTYANEKEKKERKELNSNSKRIAFRFFICKVRPLLIFSAYRVAFRLK